MSTRPVAARPSRFYNGGAPADRVLQVRPSPRRQGAAVRLFRGEAVEQAVAAGALEIVLAAASVRARRGMRRVAGLRRVVVAQALPVVLADHRGALAALGPVAAGAILTGRERGVVGLRAGQDVVHVGSVAPAVDGLTLLGQRRLLVDVVRAVQLGHVLGHDDALGVLPGAAPDPVARVDRAGALRAQIGVPGLTSGARGRREQEAVPVRTGETAEIAALPGADAGDEEGYLALLRLTAGRSAEQEQHQRCQSRQADSVHVSPPLKAERSTRGKIRRSTSRPTWSGPSGSPSIGGPSVSRRC